MYWARNPRAARKSWTGEGGTGVWRGDLVSVSGTLLAHLYEFVGYCLIDV